MNRFHGFLCVAVGLLFAGQAVATDVSGPITTTTWTKANSPYHVTGTITVPAGNTLTIEAGVDVLFDADVQFVVWGALNAVGTETDSIRFVKSSAAEWGGLRISGGDSSTIAYTRISDGHAEGSWPNNCGGGIYLSGSDTRLGMHNSVVTGNTASGYGGGLCNASSATATLTNCTINGNTASTYGGGMFNKSATATLTNCTITGNRAWDLDGGGLCNFIGATATLTNCTITGNCAFYGGGGGLYNENSATATLTNCTITGNTAYDGGGLCNKSSATATLTNCTITGNRTAFYYGGGLYNYDNATATLTNCTITGNTASYGGGLCNKSSATATLTNCIMWGDSPQEVYVSSGTVTVTYSDIEGGYTGTGNINADPLFVDAAAGDYHLQAVSPCIDTGDPYALDADGTRSDMGVFGGEGSIQIVPRIEVSGSPFIMNAATPDTLYVHNTGWAALEVSSLTLPSDFATTATFPQTVQVEDSLLIVISYSGTEYNTGVAILSHNDEIRGSIDIDLAGVVGTVVSGNLSGIWIAANGPYHVVGTVTVPIGNTLTIEAGVDVLFDTDVQFVVQGALDAVGTETDSIRFVKGSAAEWGGLRISGGGSSTIAYARISDVHAEGSYPNYNGGGIYLSGSDTHLGMHNSVVTGNTASYGGGLHNDDATATLTNCTITGNTASYGGGGMRNGYFATATLTNCTISGNTAWDGGGLDNDVSSTARLTNCTITGNTVSYDDGGLINNIHSTARLTNCTITGNTASSGGGLYNSNSATARLTNCTITGNTASRSGGGLYNDIGVTARATATLTNCIMWGDLPQEVYVSSGTVTAVYSDIEGGYPGTGNINADPLFVDSANGDFHLQPTSPCIEAGEGGVDMGAFDYPWSLGVESSNPTPTTLLPNTPNPFNPSTSIAYTLADDGLVTLRIYNALGQHVRTLVNGRTTAGMHTVTWNGRDDSGKMVASGVYLYRLVAGDRTFVKRMMMVR
jgi:hypothetical protein